MSKHGRLYLHEVVVKWGIGIMRIVATCEQCGEAVQIGSNGLPVDDAGCKDRGHVVPVTVFEPEDSHGGPRGPEVLDMVDMTNALLNGMKY